MQEKWLYNIRKNLSEQMQCGVDWDILTLYYDEKRIEFILFKIAKDDLEFGMITKYFFSIVVDEINLAHTSWVCRNIVDIDQCAHAIVEFKKWLYSIEQDIAKSLPDDTEPVEGVVTPQQAPEGNSSTPKPQQKNLEYYCQKAVKKGYLKKVDAGYRRLTISKAQLAYLINQVIPPTGKFPDKAMCLMFGETRLSKAADQLRYNRTTDGRCKGFEIIDALLKE